MRVGVARRRHRVSLETVSVSLPFGIGSMSWKVDTTQKKAAWSLYVEDLQSPKLTASTRSSLALISRKESNHSEKGFIPLTLK
ncbi:hypothetical protein [Nostoc sp. CALU 1950]|uniref:hypothetical protein n=1 Tax=Nostoc sp. CALU 1950 TaxID=3104321 RepID=UPI003EB8463E